MSGACTRYAVGPRGRLRCTAAMCSDAPDGADKDAIRCTPPVQVARGQTAVAAVAAVWAV
jgi:hypothetical protein